MGEDQALLVRDRAKNGDGEVREKRCAFAAAAPAAKQIPDTDA
jgi:hypothetical protein